MDQQGLIALLVSWLPMIVLIGVWIYFMRRGGGQMTFQKDILEEYRRHNELLARLLERTEERLARLEEADRARRQGGS